MALSQSVQTLLGLARRAGAIAVGDMAVQDALRRKKVRLVLVAGDAGINTQERFARLAGRSGVPAYRLATRDELNLAIGMDNRAVLAILSRDFAKGLMKYLEQEGEALPSPQGSDE